MIRIGDQWLADFASCNYLGLRPRPRDHRRGPRVPRALGHPPELVAPARQPACSTREIEERLTELLGCEDTLVLPTITHIHMSVIPVLAGDGTIFLDSRAHKTIYDGCQFAAARGATVKRFRFEDPDDLERLLREDALDAAAGLHGRRQQHDRQRARPARRSPGLARELRRAALRRRRPRLRRDRRARRRRALARTAAAATASSATSARPTTASSSSAGSRRPTRRCRRSSPARPSSRSC